jgi:hypothetical protein
MQLFRQFCSFSRHSAQQAEGGDESHAGREAPKASWSESGAAVATAEVTAGVAPGWRQPASTRAGPLARRKRAKVKRKRTWRFMIRAPFDLREVELPRAALSRQETRVRPAGATGPAVLPS